MNYRPNKDDEVVSKCREIAQEYGPGIKCLEVLIRYSIERDKILIKDPGKADSFYEAMTFQAVREFYRKESGAK